MVCLHATASVQGVSVYSVTNSVTTPVPEDRPLPFDSHRLLFLRAAGAGVAYAQSRRWAYCSPVPTMR